MKNKGFTLVELLAVIVVLAIVMGIAAISVNHVTNKGKNGVYKNYENTLKGSTESFLIYDYMYENGDALPKPNNSKIVTYEYLFKNNYIDPLKDPNGGNCNDSYVVVQRDADVEVKDDISGDTFSSNFDISYKVCLICDNYPATSECPILGSGDGID